MSGCSPCRETDTWVLCAVPRCTALRAPLSAPVKTAMALSSDDPLRYGLQLRTRSLSQMRTLFTWLSEDVSAIGGRVP